MTIAEQPKALAPNNSVRLWPRKAASEGATPNLSRAVIYMRGSGLVTPISLELTMISNLQGIQVSDKEVRRLERM